MKSLQQLLNPFIPQHQPKSGLENIFTRQFMDTAVPYCMNAVPAWTRDDVLHSHRPAAPRSQDDVRVSRAHRVRFNLPLGGECFGSQFSEYIFSARPFNQLADPGNSRDQGLV